MLHYLFRRLAAAPLTLFGVSVLIFVTLQALSPEARSALYVREIPRDQAAVQAVIRRYGLDAPVAVQYWHWLVGRRDAASGETVGGVLRGELGFSRSAAQPVADLIRRRFPATLELTLWSALPVLVGGVSLGVWAAVRRDRPADHLARGLGILSASLPTFVLALLLLMLLYTRWRWFAPGRLSLWAAEAIVTPPFRTITGLISLDALLNGRVDIFLDALRHLALPVITLACISWAFLMRVTRASMLEVLRQDYVTTARAKGLREADVIRRHARPNALIPVATIGGLTVAALLNGAVVTETVFNYPGMGSAAAQAAVQLDVVTVLGIALVNAVVLVLANLAVDFMYGLFDPRVRLG